MQFFIILIKWLNPSNKVAKNSPAVSHLFGLSMVAPWLKIILVEIDHQRFTMQIFVVVKYNNGGYSHQYNNR